MLPLLSLKRVKPTFSLSQRPRDLVGLQQILEF